MSLRMYCNQIQIRQKQNNEHTEYDGGSTTGQTHNKLYKKQLSEFSVDSVTDVGNENAYSILRVKKYIYAVVLIVYFIAKLGHNIFDVFSSIFPLIFSRFVTYPILSNCLSVLC